MAFTSTWNSKLWVITWPTNERNETTSLRGRMDVIHAPAGRWERDLRANLPEITYDHHYYFDNRADIAEFMAFLDAIAGRHTSFLLPTFRPAFELAVWPSSGDMTITAKGHILVPRKRLSIAINAAVGYGRTVTSTVLTDLGGSPVTNITLNAGWPVMSIPQFSMICWTPQVRLISDTVQLNWHRRDCLSVTLKTVEVPYEDP